MYTYFSKKYDYVNPLILYLKSVKFLFLLSIYCILEVSKFHMSGTKVIPQHQKFGRLQCIFMFNNMKNYYAAVGQKASFES